MALALARKYRPRRFSDLLVQDHVAAVLRGAVVKNRVGHGYLLTGPRGVGKTTAARILAMALNCEKKGETVPAGEPCGECQSCQRIWNGVASLDVVEIDAASNRGVDDARELRERAMYAASQEGHHKVYIVDEAHMLTREAWNALLKILEEPPPGVVFVFATTEPQKIAQTAAPVLSRLQRFDFRRIGTPAIRDRLRAVLLAEGIEADEDALTLIARQADGGMRDALSVLDQCLSFGEGRVTALRVREILGLVADEIYAELLALVVNRDAAGVFSLLDRLDDAGADLLEFISSTGEVLRALLMLQVGARAEGLTEALAQTLVSYQGQLAAGDLLRMLRLLAETEGSLRRTANPRLAVETLLLRWVLLDRMVDLSAVLAGAPVPSQPAPTAPASPRRQVATSPGRQDASAPRASGEVPAPGPEPPSESRGDVATWRQGIAFTLEGLRGSWSDLVALAREQSRFLGEAVGAARPVVVEPPSIVLEMADDNPMHHEAMTRQRDVVERLLSQAVGAAVQLTVRSGGAGAEAPAPKVRRLNEAEARSERLKMLRGRDPALEAAADTLDLEVME